MLSGMSGHSIKSLERSAGGELGGDRLGLVSVDPVTPGFDQLSRSTASHPHDDLGGLQRQALVMRLPCVLGADGALAGVEHAIGVNFALEAV
jgi:hypothetical protein